MRHNFFPNIVCTEGTLGGSPRIDGRRLAVGDVVSFIKNYETLSEVMEDYELTPSEIKQALQYCSNLQCRQDEPTVFCHNCSLRREQEGKLDTSDLEEVTINDSTFVKGEIRFSLVLWKNYWKTGMDKTGGRLQQIY